MSAAKKAANGPQTSPENKKYEFVAGDTVETWDGRTLTRIRALVAIGALVAAGDLGGYIEAEASLQVSGNAWVYGNAGIFWASRVGSESGTLTAFRDEKGALYISRGCFLGTDTEFLSAVKERHGLHSKIGREYSMLVKVARSRVETQP